MEVLLNSWARSCCPATKPARNLPSINRSGKTFCHLICGSGPGWERACSRRGRVSQHLYLLIHRFREQARSHTSSLLQVRAYLPDLILVQLRVSRRWVAAGRSLIAYSLAFTSSDG
ncbi:hypothetical protein GDV60_26705 [Pseudomonas sp. DTU12.1]|nr:hypothetical protein GDV60_26705 [Pseudomonas sp. DTU12.1]